MSTIAQPARVTPTPYSARWARALRETAYMLSGFVLSLLWWVLLVTLISAGVGLTVTLIGIPILAGTMLLWIEIAASERWRARALLGVAVRVPRRRYASGARGIWDRCKDPVVWLDLVYLLLVFFPLSLVTFVVTVTLWGVGIGLVSQLATYWTGAGMQIGNGFDIDTLPEALAAASVGVAVLAVLPWVIHPFAAAHAYAVRSLLGPRSSERVEQLTRQRSAAVDAAVAERRRIERDLHDGAQQRLTALAIDLGRARAKLDADPIAARVLIEHAHEDAKLALAELRGLARGIHPAILTDRGLDAALSALCARSPVPVDVDVSLMERPPVSIESTAYFVVAESLANASKHAGATRIAVRAWIRDGSLVVEVEDDGGGGAHLEPRGGLEGLTTRVASVGGSLSLQSPPGGPTILHAELPCAS